MAVEKYPGEDMVFVRLRSTKTTDSQLLDDLKTVIEFDDDDNVTAVAFLHSSEGIDLEGIPKDVRDTVCAELENEGIPTRQPA